MAVNRYHNSKDRLRELRKDDMRERIKNSGLLTGVFNIKEQLVNGYRPGVAAILESDIPLEEKQEKVAALAITPVDTGRLRAAADISLRLLNKVLPDLKAIEMSGEVKAELPHEIVFKVLNSDDKEDIQDE